MLLQLTDAGVQLMQVATAPIVLDSFKIGSAYGYVPTATQTALHGSVVFSGVPSSPLVESTNAVKYSVSLGPTLNFNFGEVGLYKGSMLFAVAVFEVETQKLPLDTETDTGGNMVLEFHIPMVGENYEMWATVGQSNMLRISSIRGPHLLPSSRNVVPNVYIVQGADSAHRAYLAYTDRTGLWNFESYLFKGTFTIENATRNFFTLPAGTETLFGGFKDIEQGNVIVQVTSGQAYSTSRYVTRVTPGPNNTVNFILNAPTAALANIGDTIEVLFQIAATAEYELAAPSLVGATNDTATTVITNEMDNNGNPVKRIAATVKRSSSLPSTAANLLKQKADGLYVDPRDVVTALGLQLVANLATQDVELRDGEGNLLSFLPLLPFTNLTGATTIGVVSL